MDRLLMCLVNISSQFTFQKVKTFILNCIYIKYKVQREFLCSAFVLSVFREHASQTSVAMCNKNDY